MPFLLPVFTTVPSHPIALIFVVFIFFVSMNLIKELEMFSADPVNGVVCPIKFEPGSHKTEMCSSTITSFEYVLRYFFL